jgi:hypothetical protein
MANAYVQITPDVVFSAEVFSPVALAQPRPGNVGADSDEHAVDPRQIDLWDSDPEHAPVAV